MNLLVLHLTILPNSAGARELRFEKREGAAMLGGKGTNRVELWAKVPLILFTRSVVAPPTKGGFSPLLFDGDFFDVCGIIHICTDRDDFSLGIWV